jgi:hypothetical protein
LVCWLKKVVVVGLAAGGERRDFNRDFDRITVVVADFDALRETEARATDGARGLDAADRQSAGGIEQRARRGSDAEAPAQRSEPFRPLLHLHAHRCVETERPEQRIAGRGRAAEGRRSRALARVLDVALDACDEGAPLPVEAGLRAVHWTGEFA